MPTDDKDLKPSDIQVLSNPENIAAFFSSLGYNTDDKSGARIKQSVSALGITPDTIAKTIKHVERLADQENGTLQVYLFELSSVTVMAIRALARAFRDRAGKYLLILTSDYENIDFMFLERVLPVAKEGSIAAKGVAIRPHILTVKRRDPGTLSLRVLRRFTYTESDADAQADKLLSAFGIAEWSEKLFNNRALFSDYYLLERLPQSPEWSEQIKPQLLKLRELFANVREKFGNQKEAVVKEKLLKPVFELLGFVAITDKDSKGIDAEPDYRLYQKDAGTSGKPLAVCLAYTWNRYLDGKDETRDTETPDENPGAHVVTLLETGEASWAIVTNGKVWRLYSSKAHSRATNYYEIDLEETLAMQDPQEAFRFFWLLFREPAFAPVEQIHKGEKRTTTFLDRLIEESETYAKELGEKLKSRVFDDIFPHFAEGFIENMGGAEHLLFLSGEELEQNLREVFQGTLTFLYRLLFLLYSESRNLLPVNEVRGYWDLSLSRLKKEIADHAGPIIDEAPEKIKKAYRQDSSELYTQLSKLFGVIDQGDADVNIPLYNGGLFITNPSEDDESPETRNARFLRTNKIPDRYLALGLDMMARDEDNKTHALVALDYKSLGVRHLGSIYEGLLEFKLRIATEKMAFVKGKKTEEIVPYKEAKKNELSIMTIGRGKNAEERVLRKGSVYLENDKRERKVTGSYYTPDYIVKYIVNNTVGPVLAEKLNALRTKLREAQLTLKKERDKYKALGGKGDSPENQTYLKHHQLVDELFDIKVLDPAMGSGHFLVEAVDFISDKILGDKEGFLRAFPWNPITAELQNTRQTILNEMEKQGVSIDKNRLTDVNLLKRHILKRCIYGVDLNPMAVELAKVSLWLDCFTLGAPLSFLDHHLKCGNSLIGVSVKEAQEALEPVSKTVKKSKVAASAKEWKETEIIEHQFTLFGSRFAGLLMATDLMRHVGELSDITSSQVQQSRIEYRKALDELAPFKRILNIYTSHCFDSQNKINKDSAALAFMKSHEAEEFLRAKDSRAVTVAINNLKPKDREIALSAQQAVINLRFFHWELEYPEIFFGTRKGTTQLIELKENPGFDAVIGNPPYANEARGHKDLFRVLKLLPKRKEQYEKNMDLFNYFIHLSSEVCKCDGMTGMIIPQYIMDRSSASKLRLLLFSKLRLHKLVDFGTHSVFDEAKGHHSAIVILRRTDSPLEDKLLIKYISINSEPSGDRKQDDIHISSQLWSNGGLEYYAVLSSGKLILVDPDKPDIINKIKSVMSFKLTSEELDRGVDTSPSDYDGKGVFVISQEEYLEIKDQLTPDETKIMKPFYKANQLAAYQFDDRNYYWLIYTDKEAKNNIENYPQKYRHIRKHLLEFSEVMTSSNKPFGLHRPKTLFNFTDPNKIIWVRKTMEPSFAIVPIPYFMDESVWYIHFGHLTYAGQYLLAIFNSKIFFYWCREHKTQGQQLQIDKEIVASFPIRRLEFVTTNEIRKSQVIKGCELCELCVSEQSVKLLMDFVDILLQQTPSQEDVIHDILVYLADQIILAKRIPTNLKVQTRLVFLERLVDHVLYKLYGLSAGAIDLIEGR